MRSADGPLPIPNPPRVTPHKLFSGAGLKRSAAAAAAAAATNAESADVDRARAVQQHRCLSPINRTGFERRARQIILSPWGKLKAG